MFDWEPLKQFLNLLPKCSQVIERKELNKGRILYRLKPDHDGTFAISIIGGIDHGFAPYISKGNKYGLRSGGTIVAINDVPVFEHTHRKADFYFSKNSKIYLFWFFQKLKIPQKSQIRESIRTSAAACGELSILIDRELMTLEESLELISNERASLIEQFEVEPLKNQNLSQLTALKRENRAKNRYTDVLPYDDTR